MNKKYISISIGRLQYTYGDRRALEIAKELGADAVDFDLTAKCFDYRTPNSIYSKSDAEIIAYFSDLKAHADEIGLMIGQTHGRITGFKNIKEEDDALIANARIDCLVTKTLGAPVCVIHSVSTIHMGPDADPQLMRDLNFDMFTRILPFAREYGVKIASETFGDATGKGCCDFFGNITEFLMSYNRVCAVEDFAKYFVICVDTGHSNKATRFNGNPSAGDVIRMCGQHIAVLHLNDNNTFTDQHKIPMTGSIDWKDVLNALDEVGYNGIYNMELSLIHFGRNFMVETAGFAIKVMQNMLNDHYTA